ncbi:RNA polymerase sigma factor, sigma-70 family [Fimbriimonas ginsengisoli Gsoil 348]|uniref:RNA polymerase sigma factor, sigma-70 family n=2 Tax=Fimbriimonas ginsengisoli TaxID=1005039 RepID=A0A068NXD0_FIMGI|nr:RNA polymerase sigma factor, sigma-70 family [Fimbriimonas ginsengisoli Gsoil 348]
MIRLYHAGLYRFLRQLTRSREDAEDLAQQTLIRARDGAGRFDARASMKTWLHSIAFHEFTRWRRRQRWHLGLAQAPPIEDRRFEAVLEAEWLEEALGSLPDGMRAVFLLHEIEQMPLAEVAAVLGVPVGTVKSRLFNAREKLRARLGDRREVLHATEAYES